MRKQIKMRDVRLGMFVIELGGRWLDHPFWKTSFLLSDEKDLKSLQTSDIADLWMGPGRVGLRVGKSLSE